MIRTMLFTLLLLTAHWSPQKESQLIREAKKRETLLLTARPTFHWPFDQATRNAMMRLNQEMIPLFGYGSLINQKSANSTLTDETLETFRPAIAFGVQRRFDYDPGLERYGPPPTPEERAMLNLHYTGHMNDIVNGVVVDMSKEDLIALSEREIGYDLIPVIVVNWDDALESNKPTLYTAYTFSAPSHINPHLLPRPDYYKRVVNGARTYGDEYLELWYNTTYLGDGKTPVHREGE